jgi:hypothetical protein
MDQFLEFHKLLKVNQEDINSWDDLQFIIKTEFII